MTHEFHKFWLKITAIVVGSFGPILFLGTMAATSEPARWSLDLLSWPLDGVTTFAHPDTRFLSAISGGLLVGWGTMIWCLSQWVYDAAPEAVRKTVVVSILCWFTLDSAGSITSGNGSNTIFNVVILLAAIGPFWRPAHAKQ